MNKEVLSYVRGLELGSVDVDVGSYNVNGAVRDVVPVKCGLDSREGPGVDKVLAAESMAEHFHDLRVITCCDTLEHVHDWRGALSAMWAALKVGGRLVLTLPHVSKGYHGYPKDYWRWTPEQAQAIFKGQTITDIKNDLGVSYGLTIRKKTDELDLTVEPSAVETKDKSKKERR